MENIEGMKVSENVVRVDGLHWHNYKRIPQDNVRVTGKYLFFSEDKENLEKIAIDELETGGFLQAKIIRKEFKKGKDYVLCLYYENDSRKLELADKYKTTPNVKYRYWKSNKDTFKEKFAKK